MRTSLFQFQADTVVEWEASSIAGVRSGTAEGSFTFIARANNLTIGFTATATDAENYSSSKTFPIGGGSHTISMNWIFRVAMSNTEDGSSISGTVSGGNVFTATGNNGTINRQFTRTLLTPSVDLRIQQTKTNYTSSDQTRTISNGDNSIALTEFLGKYTLQVNNTVTGTTATWDLDGSFADSETGGGTLSLYKELDVDQAYK